MCHHRRLTAHTVVVTHHVVLFNCVPCQSINQSENFYSAAYSEMDSGGEQKGKMGID